MKQPRKTIAIQLLSTGMVLAAITSSVMADDMAVRHEFFEQRIRPVLINHCYKCHSDASDEPAGGLNLGTAEGMRKGGNLGPAVVPNDVDESLAMAAIQYDGLEMPPTEKLPDDVIADFRTWIEMGAPDTRTTIPVTSPEPLRSPIDVVAMPSCLSEPAHLMGHHFAGLNTWPNWIASMLIPHADSI